MKTMVMLLVFSTPIICAIFAGILAFNGKDGWGWFLFVAALIACSIKVSVD
ncbi:hypothetical protein RLV03_000385 [Salmonella enterica subsp. enterica serovar Benin]|uniref:Uncharacterized protein n=1 Tax=Salmonella enterica TaxID=28901 RepID=A0A759WB69_SALER|nr:hypothetical protein [Salmonella enterica]EIM5532953.1 hypothetical protein [Salmonella enterica subsp. enterica]ELD8107739.1 hypothetical protein [Salmonella enterica subsp. enterica serovar Benin]EIW3445137.1 hypothetical protein [Salmonella enterica]EJA7721891.1 hypothetical protein [Salmonella enterica]